MSQMPKRIYALSKKKPFTFRLPIKLMKELDKIAKINGMTTTGVVLTVLDQAIQQSKKPV